MAATPNKTIAPVGMEVLSSLMYLKKFLYQPSSTARVGNVALRTLDTIDPTPMVIIIVPRVTMKGGIPTRATMIPLKNPKAIPMMMISTRLTPIDQPHVL
jgi:hypothetical protein